MLQKHNTEHSIYLINYTILKAVVKLIVEIHVHTETLRCVQHFNTTNII